MSGILYIVATPLGNLGDITARAVETLKTVDSIACEDTRRTEKLLHHLGLRRALLRYDEHIHHPASEKICQLLAAGKSVALVTDAGTPAISDPGARLVEKAVAQGFRIVPIPGPSSLVAALSASGLVGEGFVFLGFLPRKPGPARRALQEAFGLGKTTVVFESPFRVVHTLELIAEIQPDCDVVVARELSKIYEEFIRGPVHFVRDQLKARSVKGEIVLMIRPKTEPKAH